MRAYIGHSMGYLFTAWTVLSLVGTALRWFEFGQFDFAALTVSAAYWAARYQIVKKEAK